MEGDVCYNMLWNKVGRESWTRIPKLWWYEVWRLGMRDGMDQRAKVRAVRDTPVALEVLIDKRLALECVNA
jgi:hypothetical protein